MWDQLIVLDGIAVQEQASLQVGKALVVSGWKNKVLAALSSMAPKALAARVAARVIARYRGDAGRARS